MKGAISLVSGWVAEGLVPGAALLIARRGHLIAEQYFGFAHKETRMPATPETLWSIASITKPVTAAAALACVDMGRLNLTDPVWETLPEFAPGGDGRPWRRDVTLRHLLTHTSGLAGFSVDNISLRRRHAPISDFIASFLKEDVHFPPGQWHLYSSVGFGLVAETVGRTLMADSMASRPLDAYERFALDLLRSFGATDVVFRPDDSQQARIAWVESTGQEGLDWEIGNSRYYRSLGMPWGGLFATARDVLALVQAFLPAQPDRPMRGAITPVARKAMTTQQVAVPEAPVTVAPSQRDITWDPGRPARAAVPWGLGWEVRGAEPGDYFGDYTHPTAFGHYGASGTIAWADPEEDLVVVLLTNRAWVSRWPTRERRAARLANTVMAALD